MKILFLSSIPSPYQIDFIRAMARESDIKISAYFLWNSKKNRNWKFDMDENMTVAGFGHKPADYLKFYRHVKKTRPEIIFIGGYRIPLFTLAVILARVNGIKVVLWLERPFERAGLFGWLKRLYLKAKLKTPDAIIAIGGKAEKIYKKYQRKTFNLPYSMDLEKYYKIERPSKAGDGISFLFSGQFIERKNVLNLVKAFKSLRRRDITLNIIGSGELDGQLAGEAEKDERVRILGFIDPAGLPGIFSGSDVFILPSYHDGWGLVVNEAMASAMPVIGTSRADAVHEFIRHKENGYICGTCPDSIRGALEYYINNRKAVLEHGQINRQMISRSDADVKNAVNTFKKIMGEVLISK